MTRARTWTSTSRGSGESRSPPPVSRARGAAAAPQEGQALRTPHPLHPRGRCGWRLRRPAAYPRGPVAPAASPLPPRASTRASSRGRACAAPARQRRMATRARALVRGAAGPVGPSALGVAWPRRPTGAPPRGAAGGSRPSGPTSLGIGGPRRPAGVPARAPPRSSAGWPPRRASASRCRGGLPRHPRPAGRLGRRGPPRLCVRLGPARGAFSSGGTAAATTASWPALSPSSADA